MEPIENDVTGLMAAGIRRMLDADFDAGAFETAK